jgi:hypothetical protein
MLINFQSSNIITLTWLERDYLRMVELKQMFTVAHFEKRGMLWGQNFTGEGETPT